MIRDTSAQDTVVTPAPRRRWLRWGLAAAAAAIARGAIAMLLSGWHAGTATVDASRLRIATVSVGTLVRDAAVNGRVVAAVSPTLYAPAASTVTLKVHAGDTVKNGDVLAQLESPELANALQRERSSFEELQAEIARQEILARKQKLTAIRDADQAAIELATAKRQLERVERAGVEGVLAKNDFDKAKDTLKSAEIRGKHAAEAAQLESSDVDLQLKTRRAQLQRQRLVLADAQRKVDELTVRAPMDGLIGSLAVADRSVVPANAPLMTLVDLSRLEVEIEIPETYMQDLGIGLNVEITAGETKAMGKVAAISPEVIKNEVLARVRFTGPEPKGLRQSQRVTARLLIDEKPNALIVPRGPFVEQLGGHSAYVVEDGVATKRPITIGATSVTAVEITSGLKAGDRVVISGTDTFDNADKVNIKE
jgi:HlyD family secretion protein